MQAKTMSATEIAKLIDGLGILVVDKNAYMRRLTRMMLMTIGARSVYEAGDGLAALHVIRHANPDVMLLDWDMPFVSGPQIIHIVRSPGLFAKPGLPIIMLTESTLRSQVREAMRLGVNEFLVKPTSPKALHERLAYILLRPRPMVKIGRYYVPEPRPLTVQSGLQWAA
jgi:two-component system chemotaxis response regulator CheY